MTAPRALTLDAVREEISLRDLAAIFFRRLPAMAVIFFAVVTVAMVWIFGIRTEVYAVTAKLLVRTGYEQAPSVTTLTRQTPLVAYRAQDVSSEVHILNSTDILADVVDSLDLDEPQPKVVPEGLLKRAVFELKQGLAKVKQWYAEMLIRLGVRPRLSPRDQVIDALSRGLDVISTERSNVIAAVLRLPVREGASDVLDAIIDRYLAARLGYVQEPEAVELFKQEMEQTLDELRAAEEALIRLEASAGIVSLALQKKLMLEQASAQRTLIEADRIELRGIEDKVRRLEGLRASGTTDFGRLGHFENGSFADGLMLELAALEKERITVSMSAIGADRRLDNLDHRFRATLDLLADHLESTAVERRAVHDERATVLAELERRLSELHGREARRRDLERRTKLLERDYEFYRQRLEEASAASDMERHRIGSVSVIQRPMDPIRPAGIRKVYLAAIASLLAMFAAVGWAAMAEFFDHRIYSANQLARYLGAPVAGVIPAATPAELARTWAPVPASAKAAE